jgi:DNA-binding MarR family transcriptional regulator
MPFSGNVRAGPCGASMSADPRRISKRQYETLSNFRYELRRYLRYSEDISRRHGVTPLQYQLLLHVKGYPEREWATVTELAERMQAKHHGIVALVTRCERAKLVERRSDPGDRRRVYVYLTRKGEERLAKLADLHRQELLLLEKRFFVPKREHFDK